MNTIDPILKFWMVWGVQRGAPTHRHSTKASAQREAERLARIQPGELFVVLAAVDARICTVSEPLPVRLKKAAPGSDDEIPF